MKSTDFYLWVFLQESKAPTFAFGFFCKNQKYQLLLLGFYPKRHKLLKIKLLKVSSYTLYKELAKAISSCKNNKSAGPDQIPYEVWKLMPKGMMRRIARMFDTFVTKNSVPSEWEVSKGTPLYKKGDAADAFMYRIISLTDTLSKIYERVILARIMPVVSTYLSTHQHGFRRGHNTEGAAFLLANAVGMGKTVHEARRHGMTYTAFIDIRKAYPTVHRPAMFSKLKQAGIGGHLFRAIEAMYHNVQSSVQVGGATSAPYTIETGVREGSVLSPVLYTIFINDLLTKLHATGEGVCIAGDADCRIAVMGYADDIVLVARTAEGLQRMLDIVAAYAHANEFQISQSKSKVVVFGDNHTRNNDAATVWYVQGLYNDDDKIAPDHIAETDKYEYLGTMFHRDRTWATQFKEAAKKFWGPASDKWMDSGALRIGAGERVTTVFWNTMVAPAMEYDPLVTISAYANQSTQKVMAPVDTATKAARQAATAGREHCDSAARMATGIHDAITRRAARCATAMARIMKKPSTNIQRKVLQHVSRGTADCQRAKQGVRRIENLACTPGVTSGWRKPSSVKAPAVRASCIRAADAAVRRQAVDHSHIRASMEINNRIRKLHGSETLPRSILCGNHLGQMVHQQIRASATRFNAYTGNAGRTCEYCDSATARSPPIENNKHVVAVCPKYAAHRRKFQQETGITITAENYIDVMALDAKKLGVASNILAKSLCHMLARIVADRGGGYQNVSVAFPLEDESNQRRPIIQASRPEREPD